MVNEGTTGLAVPQDSRGIVDTSHRMTRRRNVK